MWINYGQIISVDSVDNFPQCYTHVIHRKTADNIQEFSTYPHIHKYYYYYYYL